MANNRHQSYEDFDYNTPRRAHYGEGRRQRNRSRDYYDDYNDFEDNRESNFSYADDDDNPLYAQPGFSGPSWESSSRSSGQRRNLDDEDYTSSRGSRGSSDRRGRSSRYGRQSNESSMNRYGSSSYGNNDSGYEDYGTRYGSGYEDSSSGRSENDSVGRSRRNQSSSRYGSPSRFGDSSRSGSRRQFSSYNDDFDDENDNDNSSFGGYSNYQSRRQY